MSEVLTNLEAHGHLRVGEHRYTTEVKEELLTISAATIDRYLTPTRAQGPTRGISTTKPGTMLRTSITIRRAGDEAEEVPGFLEVDTVAHCGPSLKGEFARSVDFTDVHTGWVVVIAIRNNAHQHILAALTTAERVLPFPITGLDCDNGSEGGFNWSSQQHCLFVSLAAC
jgi:hypothetical protein